MKIVDIKYSLKYHIHDIYEFNYYYIKKFKIIIT